MSPPSSRRKRLRNAGTDLLMKLLESAHRTVLVLSAGRLGWSVGPMTAVELHTIGRKTGKRRSTMLTSPMYNDERICLIASKGGDDRNPEWYLNLVANPAVEVTVRGVTTPMRARTATRQEKARLWPAIVAVNPGYGRYQRRTSRDIPLVICEPERFGTALS